MIDIKNINIGDIWHYNDTDENLQYIGTVVAIDNVAPPMSYSYDQTSGLVHDMFVTVNWSWVRDNVDPTIQGGIGEVTYDSVDLTAGGFYSWIANTSVITEKERLSVILSTK